MGSSNQSTKLFLPFAEALVVARSLRLPGEKEWRLWSREGLRPANVPSHPETVYKDHGWQGWGHWVGSSNLHTKLFLPFAEALVVARSHGLTSQKEWRVWSKEGLRPANVPACPNTVYKDHGWQGWGHWLQHAGPGPDTAVPSEGPPRSHTRPKRAPAPATPCTSKRRRR